MFGQVEMGRDVNEMCEVGVSRAGLNKLVKFVLGRLDQTGIGEFPSELGEECRPVMKEEWFSKLLNHSARIPSLR